MRLTGCSDGVLDGRATLPWIEQPPDWATGLGVHPVERSLFSCAAAGAWLEFPGSDGADLAVMCGWGPDRTVRAEALHHLLVGPDGPPVQPRGLRLRGVRITGALKLEYAELRCPLTLVNCYLDSPEAVNLHGAKSPGLVLTGCYLTAGLTADGIEATHGLDLSGSTLRGPLVLSGADITGRLRCSGAHLAGSDGSGNALVADQVKVSAGVLLDGGFTADGAVRLPGADITGDLECSGARLNGQDDQGVALFADGLRVQGVVSFDGLVVAAGAVRIPGADIKLQLSCADAKLSGRDGEGIALFAPFIRVGVGLMLNGFKADGAVNLSEAEITGDVVCDGACFASTRGNALMAGGMKVDGNLSLDQSEVSAGAVNLIGADIRGQLSANGARLLGTDSDGDALIADQLRVGASLFLNDRFEAKGAVRFPSANVTGIFDCRHAMITSREGIALNGENLVVDGPVFLDGTEVKGGAVRLRGAAISSWLNCMGVTFDGRDEHGDTFDGAHLKVSGDAKFNNCRASAGLSVKDAEIGGAMDLTGADLAGEPAALSAEGLRVRQEFQWAPRGPVRGRVDLDQACVGRVIDAWTRERPEGHWPPSGWLHLTGFTYEGFGNQDQPSERDRLSRWICKTHTNPEGRQNFATQPYEQLARVYRQAGQEDQARAVLIARQSDLRRYGNLTRPRWVVNWLLDKTIRHGFRPGRAVWLLLGLCGLVTLGLWGAQHQPGAIVPTGTGASVAGVTALSCGPDYPCFYPLGYAIDIVVPIIRVGQSDSWRLLGQGDWRWAYVAASWVATVLGWVFATLAVAGFTGIVRKE